MIRYLIGIIVSLLVLSFIRAVAGILQKAVTKEVNSAMGGDEPEAPPAKQPTPQTMLRKCVSCGTYKPDSAMIRYGGTGDKGVYFCSADCEKAKAS